MQQVQKPRDKHMEAFRKFSESIRDISTVEKIILFGSVARDEHGVSSDVDVLVVVSDLSDRERIEDTAIDTTSDVGVSVTPIIVEKGTEKTSLIKEAEEEGVEYVRG